MKKFSPSHIKIFGVCALVFWTIGLILLTRPELRSADTISLAVLPLILLIAVLSTAAAIAVSMHTLAAREPKSEQYTHSTGAKVLAGLVIVALLVSTATALRSLWFSPLGDDFSDRFVYENVATSAGLSGIALTLLLSALQKDIYWITRKSAVSLDERQLSERREVFETSYKIAALLLLVIIWWLATKLWLLTAVIANNYGEVPGHLYWIGVNIVTTLFALPLIVAAWKKKTVKTTATHKH